MTHQDPVWFTRLPVSLQATAYRVRGEFAWPKGNAIAVIEILTSFRCRVSGVEVWLPSANGPSIPGPPYYWSASHGADSQFGDDVRTVNAGATEFIVNFAPNRDDRLLAEQDPYFNLDIHCG
jgi:hypothetical protein